MNEPLPAGTTLFGDVELDRLSGHLSREMPGLGAIDAIERFPGGLSNPTFRIVCGKTSLVLRAKPAPARQLLASAHAIEREFRVISALAGTGFPVPRPLLLCEDEQVAGVAFYVMEHIQGRIFRDATLPGMAPVERRAIYEELNRVIAALHDFDPATLGLEDYGAPGSYLERQVKRWTRQYRASETEVIEAMDGLIEWLPANLPPQVERRVVHGDYRMENVVFDPGHPRILAVLDWELSTVGDALADFAYHCLAWHMPPGETKGIEGLDHHALGIPDAAEYRALYTGRTGRSGDRAWHVYIAFNFFRLAAILQGVYKRSLEGTATLDAARRAGARARTMAERGWACAHGRLV